MKTATMRHSDVADLNWMQMPVDGGQIVDVTYAEDDGKLFCRSHDRSDNTITITYQEIDDSADEDDLRFEPQNGILPATTGDDVLVQEDGKYTVHMWDEGGGDETIEIEADDLDEAIELAEEAVKEWLEGGDWGSDGARVSAWYTVDGENQDSVEVVIDPDHEALIEAAGGDTDCDHEWTSEGEGGCTENPGVWSTGGTSMKFASHCKLCGLRKTEHHTGSQRNPGEHDTVSYEQPASWCADCQSEECEC